MLSGALQGNFLSMFSCLLQPNHVLEIGTFTGYSALCLAKGLSPQGQLHTVELREADAAVAKHFFDRSPYATQIFLHQGNAREIIPGLPYTWDLIFLDADKVSYIDYFNMVFSSLRSKGFILADNVFFHGQVFGSSIKGKNAKAVAAFNKFIQSRTDIEVVILPIRDGLSLIQKK